jgi:hypothetical protein
MPVIAFRQRLQDREDLQHGGHGLGLPGVVNVVVHRFDFFGLLFQAYCPRIAEGFFRDFIGSWRLRP